MSDITVLVPEDKAGDVERTIFEYRDDWTPTESVSGGEDGMVNIVYVGIHPNEEQAFMRAAQVGGATKCL